MEFEKKIGTYAISDKLGLSNGRCGIALYYFLLSIEKKSPEYKKLANSYVNYVVSNIHTIENLTYSTGLLGVSSSLEYFSIAFAEEYDFNLMDDIESILYRSLIYGPKKDISMESGFLGYFLFFYLRLYFFRNQRIHPYKVLFLKECCIMIIYWLYKYINKFEVENVYDMKSILQCYLLIKRFRRMDIQNELSDKILCSLKKILLKHYSKLEQATRASFELFQQHKIFEKYKYLNVFL